MAIRQLPPVVLVASLFASCAPEDRGDPSIGDSGNNALSRVSSKDEPVSQHPLVTGRTMVPVDTAFEQLVQEESEDWQRPPRRDIWVSGAPASAITQADSGERGPRIEPALTLRLSGDPAEQVRAIAWLRVDERWPSLGTTAVIERGMWEGSVVDGGTADDAVHRAQAERRAMVEDARIRLESSMSALDARVVAAGVNLPYVVLEGSAPAIATLSENNSIERLELDVEAGGDDNTGTVITQDVRADVYLGLGWRGEAAGSIVMLESGAPDDSHLGFLYDPNQGTADRVLTRYQCNVFATGCPSSTNPYTTGHATGTAGVLIGDITEGEDARWTTWSGMDAHSGVARGAEIQAFALASDVFSLSRARFNKAVDVMLGWGTPPDIVNMSSTINTGTTECNGDTTAAQSVNELFEAGALFVKSAGNTYDSGDGCDVGEPTAAASAFPIGAHVGTSLFSGSAEGGLNGRSIIALTTRTPMNESYGEGNTYVGTFNATSCATPVASGAAAIFRDWYRSNLSSFIDDPGMLAAALLLQTDRQATSGTLSNRYDSRWGAGRLKMELYDNSHQTAPWGRAYSKLCIEQGESVVLDFADGNPLESGVTQLGATAWWYDAGHYSDGGLNKIWLYLDRESSPGVWTNVQASNQAYENKARLYQGSPTTGQRYRMRVVGNAVNGTDPVCGAGSQRVYVARYRSGN